MGNLSASRWYINELNKILPRNLTWNLKRSPWKRRFLLETIIFRFHVKFRGSKLNILRFGMLYLVPPPSHFDEIQPPRGSPGWFLRPKHPSFFTVRLHRKIPSLETSNCHKMSLVFQLLDKFILVFFFKKICSKHIRNRMCWYLYVYIYHKN